MSTPLHYHSLETEEFGEARPAGSRPCAACGAPLQRKAYENDKAFIARRTCGYRCAGQLHRRQGPETSDEELLALFDLTGTFKAVGDLVDLSRERVRQRLTRLGVRSNNRGRPPKIPDLGRCVICGQLFEVGQRQRLTCGTACCAQYRTTCTPEELLGYVHQYGSVAAAVRATGISAMTFHRKLNGLQKPDGRKPRSTP